jgi:tRNA A37 threonylcarbamoyladenosine dehydratase
VGGIEAATLAKMGIGELTIFDPGVFDEPDMNRHSARWLPIRAQQGGRHGRIAAGN